MKTELTNETIDHIFTTAERQRISTQKGIDNSYATGVERINDAPARRVMVEKIIEGYLAITPQPAVRWIPAVNRKPTDEDFSLLGNVLILRDDGTSASVGKDSPALEGTNYHWMRTSDYVNIPKEPINPEAVEENEFNTWWNARFLTSCPQSREPALAAWKAARKNKIP